MNNVISFVIIVAKDLSESHVAMSKSPPIHQQSKHKPALSYSSCQKSLVPLLEGDFFFPVSCLYFFISSLFLWWFFRVVAPHMSLRSSLPFYYQKFYNQLLLSAPNTNTLKNILNLIPSNYLKPSQKINWRVGKTPDISQIIQQLIGRSQFINKII